jgi:transcriptional regulator with XRE-family HTH domain
MRCYGPQPMDAPTTARVRAWLKASRGTETQDDLATDITAKTGWRITRDRYSRYESGGLSIGKQTLAHFVAYWKGRGVEVPDFTVAPTEPEPEPTLVAALLRQSEAIEALVEEMKLARERDLDAAAAILRAAEILGRPTREGDGASTTPGVPHGSGG